MVEEKDNAGTHKVAQEDGTPCGLIVRLEKDALWSKRYGENPVLGYFDQMEFQPIYSWLQFSPRTTAVELYDENDKDEVSKQPLSMYPIKLLFPEQTVMNTLNEETGLNYTVWRGNVPELLKQNPCITVLLVNLTDEFKGEFPRDPCGAQLRHFAKVIEEGLFLDPNDKKGIGMLCPYKREWAQEANLCIMPSLGYSDYCILLAERSWHLAPVLIEFLHRAGYEKPDKENRSICRIPILSTDYVIPAYHTKGKSVKNETWQWGTQLSMRIHLRPGVGMLTLKHEVGKGIDIYQLTGSSDCVLEVVGEEAFSRLLNAVVDDRNEKAKKKIRNLVVSTETSIRRAVPDTEPPQELQMIEPSKEITQQISELRAVLRAYWNILSKEKCHMRLFNSMWDRVTSVENICSEPHNRSLQQIMRPWLETFTNCLRRCVETIEKIAQEKQRDENELYQWLKYVNDALEIFTTEAGNFLADLSRSDCFFMESERYNHPSVSSATALLIAYNRWQNEFAKDVLAEDEDNLCQYAFLVRSGGCDTTTTNNIFHSLEPEVMLTSDGCEVLKESMPLITQMSEMSLFDCGGAVLRMTHECMHYFGKRLRRDRVGYIIGFTARWFGNYLSEALFSEVSYPKRIIRNLREKFMIDAETVSDAIVGAWKQGAQKFRERIANWIEEELKRLYEIDREDWHERDYLSESLRQWMLRRLTLLFRPYRLGTDEHKFPYSNLVKFLRREQRKTVREFYDNCNAELKKKKLQISCLALDRRQVDAYLREIESQDKKLNVQSEGDSGSLTQVIMWVLNKLLTDPIYETETSEMDTDSQPRDLSSGLEEIVFDCFSECYADAEACRRLNAGLADYLVGFVFEEWNVSSAMPDEAPYLFRIPIVLRMCFADELENNGTVLSKEAENCLKVAVENLVRHGMPEQRKNAKELIARTNKLLERYQYYMWMAEPLENYLRMCERYYQEGDHSGMLKYQKAFRRIRLLDSENGSDVTQLFTNLATIGG